MTEIYFVRHCESVSNACRRAYVMTDVTVTRKGRAQAENVARYFDGMEIDNIYSSDLIRARVTAEAIAKRLGKKVKYRLLLREFHQGVWEGNSAGNLARDYPEMFKRWNATPWDHNIPGCDTVDLITPRAMRAIRDIAEENPNGRVVVVSHIFVYKCILYALNPEKLVEIMKAPNAQNCSVTKLIVHDDGNIELVFAGDDKHIPQHLRKEGYYREVMAFDCFKEKNERMDAMNRKLEDYYGKSFDYDPKLSVISTMKGEDYGFVTGHMSDDETLTLDGIFVEDPEYSEQIFGEFMDKAYRNDALYIEMDKIKNPCEQRIYNIFEFYEHDGKLRLDLTVPGIRYPIL